jgi:hypothetical protein
VGLERAFDKKIRCFRLARHGAVNICRQNTLGQVVTLLKPFRPATIDYIKSFVNKGAP